MIGFRLNAISDKNLRDLAREASHAGWRIELTNGNHVRWLPPNSREIHISSLTPGSGRAAAKTRSFLRKHGVHLDAHR